MTQSYRDGDKTAGSPSDLEPPASGGRAEPGAGDDASSLYIAQANRAQLLLDQGDVDGAMAAFGETLAGLGEEASFPRAAIMERLGRCLLLRGQPMPAATLFQQAMEVTETIALSDGVKGLQGVLQSGLGDAFGAAGHSGQARKSYEAALMLAQELGDVRAQGVDLDHLGTLALKEGRPEEAVEHFRAALGIFQKLGERPSEAVTFYHLGIAFQQARQPDEAERHFMEAARLMEERGDLAGVARCRSHLAAVGETGGHRDAAEQWYRKALDAARTSRNPAEIRRQLVNLSRFLLTGTDSSAEVRHLAEEALAVTRTIVSPDPDVWTTYGLLADVLETVAAGQADGSTATHDAQVRSYRHIQDYGPRLQATLAGFGGAASFGSAVVLERLGRCCIMGGRTEMAIALLQQAVDVAERLAPSDSVMGLQGVVLSALGEACSVAGLMAEAQWAHESALSIAEERKDRRGQAGELGHLGLLAFAQGRTDEALTRLQAARAHFEALHERSSVATTLHYAGMVYEQAERWQEAHDAYLEAGRLRGALGDAAGAEALRSQAVSVGEKVSSSETQDGVGAAGSADAGSIGAENAGAPQFSTTLYEELTTECVLGTDLLIDIRRETRITPDIRSSEPPPDDKVRPMLAPRVRSAVDEMGALRFHLAPGEPEFVQDTHCLIMRQARREIAIAGDLDVVWKVVRVIDGTRTIGSILASVSEPERGAAADLIGVLADAGVLDMSGRAVGRFLHGATRKGVLPAGGLHTDEVLRLATDGDYRAYPDAPRVALGDGVPDELRSFHALTRARRSRRDYSGKALSRGAFDALLHTACGVTGSMPWADREVKLRAYPSSGALFAVEIYPVAFRVEDLAPGVYHYAAVDHGLDLVNADAGLDYFVGASLPVERSMVAGAAALICLVGRFQRHERKYGEGGYRMMVAEAGHISQNLVLSAVAMGLSARPFGGVFDALVNQGLGLDEAQEQFLLSVLVGYAGAET